MSFVVTLLIVIFVFAFFMRWMDVMAKDRQARMKLLEEAVKAGNLDEQAREDLVAAVSGRRPRRHNKQAAAAPAPASPHRASFLERLMMFVGWMGFLTGVALLTFGLSSNGYGADELALGGVIVGLCGFGLITYPFVIRELESRGAARVPR
ncbi:MAG: hypothetical protein ACYST0_13630 [Planctomycetota bacterium]|jgi:hypothetical protein